MWFKSTVIKDKKASFGKLKSHPNEEKQKQNMVLLKKCKQAIRDVKKEERIQKG